MQVTPSHMCLFGNRDFFSSSRELESVSYPSCNNSLRRIAVFNLSCIPTQNYKYEDVSSEIRSSVCHGCPPTGYHCRHR